MRWHWAPLLGVLLVTGRVVAADQPKAADAGTPPAAAATPGTPTGGTPSAAKGFQPTGLGKAKFRMSLAEVWKMYPSARLMEEEEQGGAPVVEGPYIDRLMLLNQEVPGFEKPTTVELRFFKDKLWAVIIYFGPNDPEKAKAMLNKTFGPPTGGNDMYPMWAGDPVSSSAVYEQKWYGSTDNAVSKEAQAWFTDMFNGIWKGETPEEKAAREKRMAALTPKAGKAAKTTPTPAAAAKGK